MVWCLLGEDNVGVVKDDEPLNITDWRDLKLGDIVNVFEGDHKVYKVEPEDYEGDYTFAVTTEADPEKWVDVSCDKWKFVSRPK